MIRTSFKTLLNNYCNLGNCKQALYRSFRSVARRSNGPKLVEGKVKTVTCFDEYERVENYKDFLDSVKKSNLGDELEVEKYMAEEDDLGHVVERSEQFYDMHFGEKKRLKFHIRNKIVKRKYFNLDKETNLLTHAAKEQIRFLHRSNPLEWNYKAIAECFPTSEAGAKKLLLSNYTLTCPEKIKKHDEEVAERWKILKSGKYTTLITPLTQKLYKEGKLVDDYFSGNPNLPTAPPSQNVIHLEENKRVGEFAAIVQTYKTCKNQKLLESHKENCSENQITLKSSNDVEMNKNIDIKAVKKFKYAREEFDDEGDVKVNYSHKKHYIDNAELPLSQFKEILKEESKFKSSNNYGYDDNVSNTWNNKNSFKEVNNQQNCFLKIGKYEKNSISAMYDSEKGIKRVYKYDEKLGYQHPTGKIIKGNIEIPLNLQKKGSLYKVGECVYDDNGEFLYKVPS